MRQILRISHRDSENFVLCSNGAFKYVEGIFSEIATLANSLLFFFRVKATYNHSRIITALFGILWLAFAGPSILIMLGITRDRIPYTRYCTKGLAHQYTMVSNYCDRCERHPRFPCYFVQHDLTLH
ncbi:hypothetical protein PILCRDRAFT_256490 [Piloderma croceum F 1598]|uniref:Uncharacterized protein n=1 Tax=Piloderma croceum (strain F 1598) TaxID=765440 RepID=A0A0C3G9L1_PILCF|nr:hypothetical protein PILCRDRAFT_256490 [Piloderma croceum F 1598]